MSPLSYRDRRPCILLYTKVDVYLAKVNGRNKSITLVKVNLSVATAIYKKSRNLDFELIKFQREGPLSKL